MRTDAETVFREVVLRACVEKLGLQLVPAPAGRPQPEPEDACEQYGALDPPSGLIYPVIAWLDPAGAHGVRQFGITIVFPEEVYEYEGDVDPRRRPSERFKFSGQYRPR